LSWDTKTNKGTKGGGMAHGKFLHKINRPQSKRREKFWN